MRTAKGINKRPDRRTYFRRASVLGITALSVTAAAGTGQGYAATGSESSSPSSSLVESGGALSCDVGGEQVAVIPHFNSPFTQQFIEGATAAAEECNASIRSAGPDSIDTPVQIRQFGDLVAAGVKAIVTVAFPADLWVRPINDAVDQGVAVGTVDVASPDSRQLVMASPKQTDFGRDLGRAMVAALGPDASGEIVTGICFPGLDVLEQRLVGLREVIEEELPGVSVADPIDTTFEPATNFTAWQRLMEDNPDAIAVVGVCDGDAANQMKVRQETDSAGWLIGGLNYDPVSLDGVRNGDIAVLVGAQPFLQGYTAMRTLLTSMAGNDVPRGWIDTGTETTTQVNVDEVASREASIADGWETSREFYAAQIDAIFSDLAGNVQPFEQYLEP